MPDAGCENEENCESPLLDVVYMFAAISDGINQAAKDIGKATNNASLSAQIGFCDTEIEGAKRNWGLAAFDKFLAGDVAEAKRLAEAAQRKISELQAKKDRLVAQKAAASTPTQKLSVTVPAGVAPGGVFLVQGPAGNQLQVTCPAGVKPGDQLLIDVPVTPVAVGQRVS